MTRRARKTHSTLSIDLLADPHAYAARHPPPASDYDWRLYGTVTIDGVTGALAFRRGSYGIATGSTVRELGLWERIDVNTALEIGQPPGIEGAPRFSLEPMSLPGRW